MRDYKKEALHDVLRQQTYRRWIQERIQRLHETVQAHDVLRHFGVDVDDREMQISCPFHGADKKPSARVYMRNGERHSHVWCFVCQEPWDCIALWRKFMADDAPFTRALWQMEQAFGLDKIDPPEYVQWESETHQGTTETKDDITRLFEVCERRLRENKGSFEMRPYLTLGTVMDRLLQEWEDGKASSDKVKAVLRKVLDKIGERVRKDEASLYPNP